VSPSEEISGLGASIDRLERKTEEEKKRLDEREEILNLLRKANEEIQELKKSRVTRDEMAEFFDNFNEFLNGYMEDHLKDSKVNGLYKVTDDLRKFCTRFFNK